MIIFFEPSACVHVLVITWAAHAVALLAHNANVAMQSWPFDLHILIANSTNTLLFSYSLP